MGSYASLAVRDAQGNIVGYQSTSTGQMTEVTGAGSSAFQQLQQQYAVQKYTSVGTGGSYQQSIKYDYVPENVVYEKSAAGIALELQQRGGGGRSTEELRAKAMGEGYKGALEGVAGRSVVPIRDLSSAASDIGFAGAMTTYGGRTFYVPYGGRTQQEIRDAKAVYDPIGGRVGLYQVPTSIYESEGGFKRRYAIESASGSTGALQSGMFSIDKPLTPDVRTQWSFDKYAASADVVKAAAVRASPDKYSRMGAEAYGGLVTALDSRTLSPDAQMGRYAPATGNLANLVDPFGVNRPKAELQATEPWQIRADSPVLQTMSGAGFGGTLLAPAGVGEYAKVGINKVTMVDRVKSSGVDISSDQLVNIHDLYSNKKSEYESELTQYQAGGSTDIKKYGELVEKERELKALSLGIYGAAIAEKSIPTYTKTTSKQSGAIPFFGVVPVVSDIVKEFQPMETRYTEISIVGTRSYSEFGQTPINIEAQKVMPSVEKIGPALLLADVVRPTTTPFALAGIVTEGANRVVPGILSEIPEQNKMLKSFTGSISPTYEGIREDPSMAIMSYSIGGALGGAGGALRSVGVGTKYLAVGTKSAALYQGASKTITLVASGMYADDLFKRATGSSVGDVQRALMPAYYGMKGTEGFEGIKSRWSGLENARKEMNKAVATEIIPFTLGVTTIGFVGDRVSGWVRTRGMQEIKNPEEFTYFTQEGYPTHQSITTRDLIESFNQGTMRVRGGGGVLGGTMRPSGQPITRVPSNTQRDSALFGETQVYSGASAPHLQSGFVGAGASELPGMYAAPTGQAYFTKAGLSQGGGGFGISEDIFGIYRNPTMYRISTKTGDYVEIPQSILNTKTGGMSTNDPMNPRNQAIKEWIETPGNVKFGQKIIGQYGKSEWQTLFREGSAVKTKPLGYFVDKPTGIRIVMEGVEFSGGGIPPKVQSQPMRQVGKMFMDIGGAAGSSRASAGKVISPVFAMGSSKPSSREFSLGRGIDYSISSRKTPSYSSPRSLSYSSPSSRSPSVSRSRSSPFGEPSRSPRGSSSLPISGYGYSGRYESPSDVGSRSRPSLSSRALPTLVSPPVSDYGYSRPTSISKPPYSSPPPEPSPTPPSSPDYTPIEPTYTPKPKPLVGWGYVGGGTDGRTFAPRSLERWQRVNPVADIPYLSKGLGGPAFGGAFGSSGSKRTGGRKSKFVRYRDRKRK